jgi:hypothetical protein
MAWLKNGCLKGELLILGPLNVGARCRKSMVLLTVLDSGVRKTHPPLPQPCGVPPRVTPRRFDRLAHPAYLP